MTAAPLHSGFAMGRGCSSRIFQGLQLLRDGNFHNAAGQPDHPLTLEIAEHSGDYLPVGTQVPGNGLMGNGQPLRFLNGYLLKQKSGNPSVHALPHDLLHQPHDLRKP